MSKIDEQIKALLRKKEKISLYQQLLEAVASASLKDPQHEGLLEEFQTEIKRIVKDQIALIESDSLIAPSPYAIKDSDSPKEEVKSIPPQPVTKQLSKPKINPLEFLQRVKTFENKTVVFSNKDGEFEGVVTGMDATEGSLLISMPDKGYYNIRVPLENVRLLEA